MDATDLAFAGLARQAELIRLGEVSARELTELALERIGRLDPTLNAFRVVVAEEALAAADAADARRAAADDAPPLNGVPIAIKDDTDMAGQSTARGSLATGGAGPALADAEIVRRLRAAGAVVVGKTQVPELETMPFTESLAFGATRNPWDLTRTPGGSSGGAGAAVAAGLVAAAHGTDGVGSIRVPAGCCGLFGLKPQRGRLPTHAAWPGLVVSGPITRRVLDAALFCAAAHGPGGPDFAAAARRPPGRLRIALSTKLPPLATASLQDEPRGAVELTAERLRALGHTVVECDPDYGRVAPAILARYLDGVHREAAALPDPERLSRRTRALARLGGRIPAPALARALASEERLRTRLAPLFVEHDLLLTPLFPRLPFDIAELDGRSLPVALNAAAGFVEFLGAWNHTGQPAAAVPTDVAADGFPIGVQLVGRPGDEVTLLALAAQLESELGWPDRRPPLAA